MGLMTFLRNRAGLIVTVIGIAIVAFLLGDVVRTGAPFWASTQNQVGSVNGESISYPDFNVQVEQASAMFQQQMGGGSLTPQMKNYAVQQVWNQFVTKEILKQEVEKIGLSVGKDELNALVNGPNPSYQIVQAFTNPQTGQFDKAQLNMFLSRLKSEGTPEMQQQWEMLLEGVRDERMGTKYTNLLNNSIYVTSLEANDDYIQRNKLANFKYVLLDYSSIKDADIKLTDADYKEYYDENKNAFKNPEETRAIEYVLVDGRPNQRDTAATLAVVQKLKADLAASTNDSLFASVNSDTKYPYTYLKKGQVSPALDSVLFNAPVGATVGPFLSNGVYEIAKIKDATFSPDSVKASHILLNPTAEGGVDKAKAKADSIKNLIAKGEAFGPLAIQFSQDEGSKANGGDLGTFGRGRMVPEFDKAVFEGKTGDVLIVNSQFGVHIVKIEKQVGNSKVVKAAIVDKAISSGKETIDAAYAKANSFFSALDKDNFKAVATKQGLKDATAKRVTAMDNTLDGNEVPRELLRWAFEAKKGDVTDKVYETDHTFIVARLADIQPKGILPLEAIKADIETPVRNLVKARQLKEKAENALKGASSIDQVGQKLGKSPIQVENIVLANPVIPGVALENAVVGTVFGLQPNKPSTAIKGNQGVYVVQVNGFVNPKNQVATEIKAQQKQLIASKAQRSWNSIFKALQDKAKIDDNRIRFF
ncbi:PPIC-type PPIASE domain protein [Sphingobacterium spiritivorum ATCC 33300]|uniref:Periplasmic chaperone PpiD n=1 Tax=Sphingobacterium spiritivorum ATCC 33300 TaxID=525372 RepID=C2FZS4_SPHSI|nr:SurA N-terminal domain-containing protein [Sphingobacterium spiritivorum]EEI91520.1 PPIC-type PPIASE domain protein [Sphingobacterium spiritivorum ATCC 33300]QQS97242.1 SurA N-terminal domain-containing protein [Sphingobacterium spiritivorum]